MCMRVFDWAAHIHFWRFVCAKLRCKSLIVKEVVDFQITGACLVSAEAAVLGQHSCYEQAEIQLQPDSLQPLHWSARARAGGDLAALTQRRKQAQWRKRGEKCLSGGVHALLCCWHQCKVGMQLWQSLAGCRCSWKGAAPLQHHPFHLSAFLVPFSLSFLSLASYLTFLCLIVKSE